MLRSVLRRRSRAAAGLPRVSDTIVPLQGVSYQAAQWLEKTVAMEALGARRPGLKLSANVAPITNTRSMGHRLFQIAFRGAESFGVEIFTPETTRTLCTLLYVEDLLGDRPAVPAHFHGGAFTVPYTANSAIRMAAVRGLVP